MLDKCPHHHQSSLLQSRSWIKKMICKFFSCVFQWGACPLKKHRQLVGQLHEYLHRNLFFRNSNIERHVLLFEKSSSCRLFQTHWIPQKEICLSARYISRSQRTRGLEFSHSSGLSLEMESCCNSWAFFSLSLSNFHYSLSSYVGLWLRKGDSCFRPSMKGTA